MSKKIKKLSPTTIAGVSQFIVAVCGLIGITLSPEQTTLIGTVVGVLYSVLAAFKGYYTEDKKDKKD